MKKHLVLGVLLSGLLAVGGMGITQAGAVTASETVHTVTYGNQPPNNRVVVAVGPILGAATETINGPMVMNMDGSTTVPLKWAFPGGNVFVSLRSFQNFENEPVPPLCEVVADISGTWTITGGTGIYAGVSGSGTVTGTGRVFAVFTPGSGCSEMAAVLMLNTKTYTGTVSGNG